MTKPDLPRRRFTSADEFDAWLEQHHGASGGLWLQVGKKGNPEPSVTRAEFVPLLLRWGWIDGQVRSLDEHWYLQRITPRRPRSVWSKVNVAYVEQLLADGRMQPPGLAQVEAAKADGRWDAAYAGSATMEPPPELQAALDADPAAARAFEALTKSARYSICWAVHNAKRPETKARRVARALDELKQ